MAEEIAAKVEVGLSPQHIYLSSRISWSKRFQLPTTGYNVLFASLRPPSRSGSGESGAWKLDPVRKYRWTSGWEPRFTTGLALRERVGSFALSYGTRVKP